MKQYTVTEIDMRPFRNGPNRAGLRKRLFLNFANEIPGTGKQEHASHYRYTVETLKDGNVIAVVRPGRRDGVDFRIEVTGYKFGHRGPFPKYEDIYQDLLVKQAANEKWYRRLLQLIDLVYNCEDVKEKQLQTLMGRFEGIGYPVDLVLWLCKWFFIELDMKDWSTFGRSGVFYNRIPR